MAPWNEPQWGFWAFEPRSTGLAKGQQWLNIGCGSRPFPGFLNTDKHPGNNIDILVDLDELPLPFDDGSFDFIYASHILEHIWDLEALVIDLIRISLPGAIWEIHSPIGRERLEVIDHKRIVTDMTFRNWFKSWPSHDANVLNMRENVGSLELAMKPYYNRDLRIGPISAYHFRKYLGMEPPGRRSQMVIVLRVIK